MTKQSSEHYSTKQNLHHFQFFIKITLSNSDCSQLFNIWHFLFPIKLIPRKNKLYALTNPISISALISGIRNIKYYLSDIILFILFMWCNDSIIKLYEVTICSQSKRFVRFSSSFVAWMDRSLYKFLSGQQLKQWQIISAHINEAKM